MTRTILFVGMADSPHAAKWIQLVADRGWNLHFFPIDLVRPNPLLQGVTLHYPWRRIYPRQSLIRMVSRILGRTPRCWQGRVVQPLSHLHMRYIYPLKLVAPFDRMLCRWRTMPLGESDVTAPRMLGPKALARAIRRLKPDLVHTLEFQHAGYLMLAAKDLLKQECPAWLATNWGSDIYYYQRFEDHRKQITRLLQQIDYYSCECERDVALALALGMTAKVLPVLPNTGGFDIAAIGALRGTTPTSQRRIMMVKGYQHFAGRALTALAALEQCAPMLQGYEVVVFSASVGAVQEKAQQLQQQTGIVFTVLPYSDHRTILYYLSRARIYLGVSISDAISTSMLEAMAMGAFPIQTNTSCCDEWIEDGVTGFSIPADDVAIIVDRIVQALRDDLLVDAAAAKNWDTVCARLDANVLQQKEIAFYDAAFSDIHAVSIRQ